MPRFNTFELRCRIHTRKKGLLSKIAHDLCFEATRFTVSQRTNRTGIVRLDPMALQLVGAERDGVIDRKLLSISDQRRVVAKLRQDVLDVRSHAEIVFTWDHVHIQELPGRKPTVTIEGTLQLHGITRNLKFTGHITDASTDPGTDPGADPSTDQNHGAEAYLQASLDQRDFGIKPYRAALGALQVEAIIRIELWVPASALKT